MGESLAPASSRNQNCKLIKARRQSALRIFQQNCRGLKSDTKRSEFWNTFLQRRGFAACLQETWTEGSEVLAMENGGQLLLEGPDHNPGRGTKGLGMALSALAVDAWNRAGCYKYVTSSNRAMAVKLLIKDSVGSDVGLFLVSAYAPIGSAPNETWDWFMDDLDEVISRKPANYVLLCGADINSCLGTSMVQGRGTDWMERYSVHCPVGPFGNSRFNLAGQRFRSFMAMRQLVAPSTFYKKTSYSTWFHPCSHGAYQIDHFCVISRTDVEFATVGPKRSSGAGRTATRDTRSNGPVQERTLH